LTISQIIPALKSGNKLLASYMIDY